MARRAKERRDHRGQTLPAGVYSVGTGAGPIVGYRVRWREEGRYGVERHSSRTFSVDTTGSLDRALEKAVLFREEALRMVRSEGSVVRLDPAGRMALDELFEQWCLGRGPQVSERYAEKVVGYWAREISPRIGKVRIARLSNDPGIITRFQDDLLAAGVTAGNRVETLKTLRAVLRWGRRRHPNALTVELSGLFEMPRLRTGRLAYATDAYGLERLIEAALRRGVRDGLYALRDAAFIAAMGFTIAARPSEWLHSATWGDVKEHSVELQRPNGAESVAVGLKTGARAALMLSGASLRLEAYREALEERFGRQPPSGLVFQALGSDGPLWVEEGGMAAPLAWDFRDYQGWTARVWRRARKSVAGVEDVDPEIASMRFYDCRHTAISMALHSTLVVGPHGMNLHNLAGWAGHDVQTLQRYYAHIIARYHGGGVVDLEKECTSARWRVEVEPAEPGD